MFLINSRLSLFTAATSLWLPFSLSYGVILQSSLTRVLPFVLGFSPRLPVSVCGTGTSVYLAAFLASVNSPTSLLLFGPRHTPAFRDAYFTTPQPQCLNASIHQRASAILLCPCFVGNLGGTGISTSCPSSTPFGLNLGPDLPWEDEPFPRKPKTFDGKDSHFALATYAGILSCMSSMAPFDTTSANIHCSSTDTRMCIPKLRCTVLAPVIFGASSLDQ